MSQLTREPVGRGMVRIALAISLLALLACAGMLFCGNHRMKIGFVRTSELVYGFSGMKEAHDLFEKKRLSGQALLDSLNGDYQRSLSGYTARKASLNAAQQKEGQQFLVKQEQNLEAQRADLEGRIRDEDQRMTQGVLSQINSLTQEYGKEHGYDLILATTQSGNILYGDEAIDLTKELLAVLNRRYNPQASKGDSAHAGR
ncbi:MAG: OmpH family outer membrane protein [Bacteroidetes bacterium]|nr:OmpH family outer membrane protein [Bacteroidota bacterium]